MKQLLLLPFIQSSVLRLLILLLPAAPRPSFADRPLHYVVRSSSLERTLEFVTKVLGMQILRHEENDSPCPITCNGASPTPWSKTMVGYGPEDSSYALEVTYNYGVDSYEIGGGFGGLSIEVPTTADEALASARELGYEATSTSDDGSTGVVFGPDGYEYRVRSDSAGGGEEEEEEGGGGAAGERFHTSSIRSGDPKSLSSWYVDVLGMTKSGSTGDGSIKLTFGDGHNLVGLVIRPTDDGKPPVVRDWDGRNAIGLPESRVRAAHARMERESPERIVHPMQELNEKLGTLVILIVADPEGHEICLVSEETFDPSVREATDFVGPDWKRRREIERDFREARKEGGGESGETINPMATDEL